jgi:hypothetical protein
MGMKTALVLRHRWPACALASRATRRKRKQAAARSEREALHCMRDF